MKLEDLRAKLRAPREVIPAEPLVIPETSSVLSKDIFLNGIYDVGNEFHVMRGYIVDFTPPKQAWRSLCERVVCDDGDPRLFVPTKIDALPAPTCPNCQVRFDNYVHFSK